MLDRVGKHRTTNKAHKQGKEESGRKPDVSGTRQGNDGGHVPLPRHRPTLAANHRRGIKASATLAALAALAAALATLAATSCTAPATAATAATAA